MFLLAAVVLLYAGGLDTRWHVGRDSCLYLGLGRSIAAGAGMTFNGVSHAGGNIGLPLLWAGVIKVCGENYLIGRLIMVALAMVMIGACYRLVRELRGEWLATLVLIVVAANGRLWSSSQLIQTDLPFAALLAVAMLGARRFLAGHRWAIVYAGLALGAAVLVRLVGGMFLPLIALGLLLDRSTGSSLKRRFLGALALGLIVLPFVAGWYLYYRSAASAPAGYLASAGEIYSSGAAGELLSNIWNNFAYELPRHTMGALMDQRITPALSIPLCLVLLPGLVRSFRRREGLLLVPALAYVAFLLTWARTSVDARYLMPLLPMLAMWFLDGAHAILSWVGRRRPALARLSSPARSTLIVAGLVGAAGLVPNVVKDLSWRFEPTAWQVESGDQVRLCSLTQWLAANTRPADRLLVREEVIVHYWTGRPTWFPPDPAGASPVNYPGQPSPQYMLNLQNDIARRIDLIVLNPTNDDRREVAVRLYVDSAADQLQKVGEHRGYVMYRVFNRQ